MYWFTASQSARVLRVIVKTREKLMPQVSCTVASIPVLNYHSMSKLRYVEVSLLVLTLCCLQPYLAGQARTSNQIGVPYPKQGVHIGAMIAGVQPQTQPLPAIEPLQCSTVPTATTSSFEKYYYLTTDIAGQLGINWIGSVNASVGSQQVVLIREYRKYAQCATTDGSGVLQYGAAVRATVQVSADSLQAGLNFAVVAASATLKSQSASVLIENIGFTDPALETKIQAAMQDVASTGLTVDKFGDFNKDLEAALTEAASSNAQISSPYQRLAFVPNLNTATMSESMMTAFGLSCMAKGWGCADAQRMFPNRNADSDAAIQQLYTNLANSCAGVSPLQEATAQALLSGIATVPTCHN
jgi:hypothetical protein